MKDELSMMINILSKSKEYILETTIAHIVKRDPDFITYGGACPESGGGYSKNLFWWHAEWHDKTKALTLKNLRVASRYHKLKALVSINLLEFAVEIINYAAIIVLFRRKTSLRPHEFPLLLNWTDNMVTKAWIREAASRTNKGKA